MALTMDGTETTFYEDDSMRALKSKMTLDFNSTNTKKMNAILNSPDLQLLKLASPELERMIIQHNGMVTTTPTPSGFKGSVTEEQEAYARGFVDALAELHQKPGQPGYIGPINGQMPSISSIVTLANQTLAANTQSIPTSSILSSLSFATTTSLPGSLTPQQVPSISSTNMAVPNRLVIQPQRTVSPLVRSSSPQVNQSHPRVMQLKEEPEAQMVPSLGLSPPISPICMVNQEVIKLDRKRARNRVAARKCRTRKLERISRLEDRVSELKGQNNNLHVTAADLRNEVGKLKQQIMEHVNSGCQVMMSQNLL